MSIINELLINFVSVGDSSCESFYHGFLCGRLYLVTQKASRHSLFKIATKDSATALSQHCPLRIIVHMNPTEFRSS